MNDLPFSVRFGFRRARGYLLPALVVIFLLSLGVLLRKFYVENTIVVPTEGGTYIEGSVGELHSLIPWFTVTNDVNSDIVSLVFAGLLKYDPDSHKIKDDLATFTVSGDGKDYVVRLKEGLFWHDSTAEHPHPVTSEDILFTFKTIQDPDFPNQILRQNFLGVTIEKVDDRSVRFHLDEPYSFFTSNLTLGLMPKKSFDGVPVAKLQQVTDFGFDPVGGGPYRFKSIVQTELSTEVTLEKFERNLTPQYKLNRIIFRIFPDYNSLLSDIRNLHGIRLVPTDSNGSHIIPRHFVAMQYSLPQYVALFFNLDKKILSDQKLRLGLQLGTNKQEIANAIHESLIVDTPLLELDTKDWRYSYDQKAAQGALFESSWNLPEKVRLQRLLELREANRVGPLSVPPIVLLDTGAMLTITGSTLNVQSGSMLNGVHLAGIPTQTGAWTVTLTTNGGSGSIAMGMNALRLIDRKGKILDSAYVWRTVSSKDFRRAAEEQDLVDLFLKTRDEPLSVPETDRIGVGDLFLENGMLRRRLSNDPKGTRINDAGQQLHLRLLTSPTPPQYRTIANLVQREWADLGVSVDVVIPETRKEFEDKLIGREYDILLFGQSLLNNLDAYPYWHSSATQRMTGNKFDLRIDAYNLSQYSSLPADSLLEIIRKTDQDKERQDALSQLRDLLKTDVPAIFLYSPLYSYAHHEDVHGVELGSLSVHSDRFLTLHNWYIRDERIFMSGKNWWSFFPWLISKL